MYCTVIQGLTYIRIERFFEIYAYTDMTLMSLYKIGHHPLMVIISWDVDPSYMLHHSQEVGADA